jgi:LAO/AO transport system kinase
LWTAVRGHQTWLGTSGRLEARRRERLSYEILAIAAARVVEALEASAGPEGLTEAAQDVLERRLDPYTAAEQLLGRLGLSPR